MQTETFANTADGVAATLAEVAGQGFVVTFRDTDAEETIGTRVFRDASADRAREYAQAIVAGRAPAGEETTFRIGPVTYVLGGA